MAAPRCPDCNKFMSTNFEDPEIEEMEIDDEGYVSGSVRFVLACEECGTELREAHSDIDFQVDHTCLLEPDRDKEIDDVFEIEEKSIEGYTRGGMKKGDKWYVARVAAEWHCMKCNEKEEETITIEVNKSDFEDIY